MHVLLCCELVYQLHLTIRRERACDKTHLQDNLRIIILQALLNILKYYTIIVLDDYPFDTEYSNVMPYKSVHLEKILFCFFIFLLFFEI